MQDQIGQTGISAAKLAAALRLWRGWTDAHFELINHTENATFLLQRDDGTKSVLRVHRFGYNSAAAIHSELAWMQALRRDQQMFTPSPIAGENGAFLQSAPVNIDANIPAQFMVLFEFEGGREPREDEDLQHSFAELGRLAAKAHTHVQYWTPPTNFERLRWTENSILDADGLWGDWRKTPLMGDHFSLYAQLDEVLRYRLAQFGKGPDRYGLIHADMRLANLLIDGEQTKLIDFDDCGYCWFLYDFAAAISFMEDSPTVPALKAAWLKGYREIKDLSADDEAEIDTFIMLRRMALTAWIGSHISSPFAAETAKDFVPRGVPLIEDYLSKFG
ncbi:phosphotransferase enzyme family protein [Maritalea mediterranea]|uniref:Phosphotransferase n=1 Tax=Maritalea mediterranea TaxID=2909667 RepID=A0ABS9E5X7_9HYPH|nr:phosphotransferase [Maritalea mediterranea]MCF4098207.1 phosphotransferase [Maritalea mediterranea]